MSIVLPSSSRALAVHVLDGSSERDFPLMRRKMLPQRFDKVSDFLSDTFFRKFSQKRIYEIYIKCGALYVPNRFLYYYQIWFYFTFVKLRQKVLRTFCFFISPAGGGTFTAGECRKGRKGSAFSTSLYHLRVKAPLPRKSVALSRAPARRCALNEQSSFRGHSEPAPCEFPLSGGVQTEYDKLCPRTFILGQSRVYA